MGTKRTLFTGGTVVAPDMTTTVADVVVEAGRFVDVGSGLDGDETIDVTGKYLYPGLFDCHAHLGMPSVDLFKDAQQHPGYLYYRAIGNLRKTLETGVTTVRDAAGTDAGMKRAIDEDLITGPRVLISIAMISQTGGHGDGRLPNGNDSIAGFGIGNFSRVVDGPDQMRVVARTLIRDGADVFKVATSGGVLSPGDDHTHPHFRLEEMRVLTEEAEVAGLHVMAHAHGTEGIKTAIRAGVRSIEHGTYLDDEAVELMVEHGVWLVPTLIALRGIDMAVEAGVEFDDYVLQKAAETAAVHRESFNKALDAGVKIAMGTDCPVAPHGVNLQELAMMVEFGMTPSAALQAATTSAAGLLHLQDELGSIEPGKLADLVVADADPQTFVTRAPKEQIEQVWKAGARVV